MYSKNTVIRTIVVVTLFIFLQGCEDTSSPYSPELLPYSIIPCLRYVDAGIPSHVIETQTEYDSLISPRGCGNLQIDFTRYTLLGQNASGSGCTTPYIKLTVTKDIFTKEIIYRVQVLEHGPCDADWQDYRWVLISKIPEDFTVKFIRENVRDS